MDLVAYLFINCSWTWCSHTMMHKDQSHIKRNCFSIGIIPNQLQSGCYREQRTQDTKSEHKHAHKSQLELATQLEEFSTQMKL
jgi:hypothetical protein